MPTEIEATYRVVTPMFCAGADRRRAELRAPSFKGVLRFWWRALAWSRLNGDLRAIQHQEDSLFGSPGAGQSRVSIMPIRTERQRPGSHKDLRIGPGVRYLGYGVMDAAPDQRGFLREGFDFTVQMRTRDLHAPQEQALTAALTALGVFGGMGARSRKGWGSLLMHSLRIAGEEQWREPRATDDLIAKLKTFLTDSGRGGFPEYTALSKKTRHLLIASEEQQPMKLLDLIGRELKDAIRSVPRNNRIAFGLPRKPHADRRAGPLFIHIHECSRKPVAVLSFLPARFLLAHRPSTSGRARGVRPTPEAVLYRPVHDFLDRLLDPNRRKEPLRAVEIKS